MENRQPTYPGRVLITPEIGEAYYATITRADEPTVEGTPLNKSTLLQDMTCEVLGIPKTSVPNDAFMALGFGKGMYGYLVHVQYQDGSPAEGCTLTGVNAPDGSPAVTNENGDAIGVSESQNVTIGVNSPYLDVENSIGQSVSSTDVVTEYVVTLDFADTVNGVSVMSSQVVRVSPFAVTIDMTAVGGGGAGGIGDFDSGGGGGGGGQVVSTTIDAQENRELNVVVGAGGVNSNGGKTSVSSGSTVVVTAAGGVEGTDGDGYTPGSGGTGYGNGGDGAAHGPGDAGGSNSNYKFGDSSLGLAGGGGGGGGGGSGTAPASSGGNPFGGNGGGDGTYAESGSGFGGGGGGAPRGSGGVQAQPGNGYQGVVFFRFHYPEYLGVK